MFIEVSVGWCARKTPGQLTPLVRGWGNLPPVSKTQNGLTRFNERRSDRGMGRLMNRLRRTTLDRLQAFIEGFVLRCEETGRIIRRLRKGLRRSWAFVSLSTDIARDPLHSHAWPSDAPFPAQTLGRLSVSRCLGYRGFAFACMTVSVPDRHQSWQTGRLWKS
jgi:hypothetical protein